MNIDKNKWVEAKPQSKFSKVVWVILGFIGLLALIFGLMAK
jgi:hypothetical protein